MHFLLAGRVDFEAFGIRKHVDNNRPLLRFQHDLLIPFHILAILKEGVLELQLQSLRADILIPRKTIIDILDNRVELEMIGTLLHF